MIRCEHLRFAYPGDAFELRIGRFDVAAGETVALVGPSGCGKTTLFHLVSGCLSPAEGSIVVDGIEIAGMSLAARQRFRIGRIGLVPQNFELLDYLTVEENLLVPFRVSSALRMHPAAGERCRELAGRAGIAAHLGKYPGQLSQGERQRAALCRGLASAPRLILADEPTGNLDPENQDRIVSLLLDETARIGATLLMITHDPVLLPRFSRVVEMPALRKGGGS